MRAMLPLLLLLPLSVPVSASAEVLVAPVTISPAFYSDMSVSIRPFKAEAEEIWFIAGECREAEDATVIRLVEFAAVADLTVFLTDAPEKAHRSICWTNPGAYKPETVGP